MRRMGQETDKKVVLISTELLDENQDQKFRIRQQKVLEIAKSIQMIGLLEPIRVRDKADGRYEIIAGRHRKRACCLLGMEEVPCYVENIGDIQARLILICSNLERNNNYLPSELAYAYVEREKLLKELNGTPGPNMDIKPETAKTRKTIYRYKRLVHLTKELLNMVDQHKLTIKAGVELSYLPEELQHTLYKKMKYHRFALNEKEAHQIVSMVKEKRLDEKYLQNLGKTSSKPTRQKPDSDRTKLMDWIKEETGNKLKDDELVAYIHSAVQLYESLKAEENKQGESKLFRVGDKVAHRQFGKGTVLGNSHRRPNGKVYWHIQFASGTYSYIKEEELTLLKGERKP